MLEKNGISFWYAAAFIFGGVQMVALPLLIPGYIYQLTGSMTHSGGALAMVGLSGFAAPLLGGLIDKFKLHAWAQQLAVLGYGFAMLCLAFGNQIEFVYLATFLVGISSIILLTVNPALIVSAGLDSDTQALKLTRMNQSIFVGAIVVGLMLFFMADISYQVSFIAMAVLAGVAFIITGLDNQKAATGLTLEASLKATKEKGSFSLTFILLLLAVFTAMLASSNQVAQAPNLFDVIFQIDKSSTALLLTFSFVISLVTLDIAGRWLKSAGAGSI
jgi:MFS family permease